jgi:hypothetical protein
MRTRGAPAPARIEEQPGAVAQRDLGKGMGDEIQAARGSEAASLRRAR